MLTAGLYSALEASLMGARGAPRVADAVVWQRWLDGAQRRGEFRGAERDWLGIDAWLERQDGPVSRDALRAFARGNRLELEVVVKGTPEAGDVMLPAGWSARQEADRLWRVRDDRQAIASTGVTLGDALRGVPGSTRDTFSGSPLYGDLVLPGGEAYREVLVRLQRAETDVQVRVSDLVMDRHRDTWEAMQRLRERAYGTPTYPAVLEEEARLYGRLRDQTIVDMGGWRDNFGRSHFDENNVLVHLRLTRRLDEAGQRVLFIEEVQSDWHQAGRVYGYRPPTLFQVLSGDDGRRLDGPFAGRDLAESAADQRRQLGDSAMVDPPSTMHARPDSRVPDAPFKATGDWAALAFKQALRIAVHNGDAVVAWTTGDMQNARYDLSKHLSMIRWTQHEDGRFDLEAIRSSGGVPAAKQGLTPQELTAAVGKEVAGKILAAAAATPAGQGRRGCLDHTGLQLLGDGMRAFYDGILPHAVGRYVKPMQGTVETVRLPVPQADEVASLVVPGVTITPAMRASVLEGQPLFRRDLPSPMMAMGGMTVDAVASIAREYLANYRHGLNTLAVRIGQTLEDLYGPGATEILGPTTTGAYHPARGLLALAADRMRDRACVEATLRHELLGHFGLNTFLPEDKRAILDEILASRDAPGMRVIWDAVDRRYVDRDMDTRAEEVFALIAEQPRGRVSQLWDRVLALVNKGLRAVRLTDGHTSKAELQVLAQSIARGLREGHRRQQTYPATDDAQFRRTDPSVSFLLARNQSERLRRMAPDQTSPESAVVTAAPSP